MSQKRKSLLHGESRKGYSQGHSQEFEQSSSISQMVVSRQEKKGMKSVQKELLRGCKTCSHFFPEECMHLLILLLKATLNDDQVVATAKFLNALSFDGSFGSFIPHCILQPFVESNDMECEAFKALLMHCNRECSLVGPFLHVFYSNGIIPRQAAALLKYLYNRIFGNYILS